jgi:hypothetical protein
MATDIETGTRAAVFTITTSPQYQFTFLSLGAIKQDEARFTLLPVVTTTHEQFTFPNYAA